MILHCSCFFMTRFGAFTVNLLRSLVSKEAVHENDIVKTAEAYHQAKTTLEDPQMIEEEMAALYHLIENWKPDLIIGCSVAWYLAVMIAKIFHIPAITMSLQLDRPCRSIPLMGIGERFPKFKGYRPCRRPLFMSKFSACVLGRENHQVPCKTFAQSCGTIRRHIRNSNLMKIE